MTDHKAAPNDFGFGEDEIMLRDMAHKFLQGRFPTDTLRRVVAQTPEPVYEQGQSAQWDKGLWQEIVDLGWTGLAVSETQGGAGISMVGIAGILEEVGRHALPSPLISTLSACQLLSLVDTDVSKTLLSRIAGDAVTATLAITNEQGSWEPEDAPLYAVSQENALLVNGCAHFVQDALKSDLFIASARVGENLALVALRADQPGVCVEQDHIHDLTRDQAHIECKDVKVEPDAVISLDAIAALRASIPRLLVLLSADLCGASEWLLQATVEYAKERVQFDRPIGFFQAVKHPLVNAMIDIDRARSLLYHAAAEIDTGTPQAEVAARMAKSAASDAAAFISGRAVQLHGGIGFTWEHALHIYFKRNLHNQALYGDGVYQRKKLADALIGPINAT